MVFALSFEEWMKSQRVEMEADEGIPGRENNLSRGWEAESSGYVQGRMSVQIPVSF